MSGKRIIPTPKKAIERDNKTNEVLLIPSTENLIVDALSVIELEICKFRVKVKSGKSLDQAEGRLLNGYIKSLVELSKEARERAKQEDLSNLTDEELLNLAKQALGATQNKEV